MKWLKSVVERVFPGTREARLAMEESQAGAEHVDRLVADLTKLQRENHFSQALSRTIGGR